MTPDMPFEFEIARSSPLSCPAKARHPVRRSLSIPAATSLEYWIARSSRAMTPNMLFEFEIAP
jgi:hypothetical protein